MTFKDKIKSILHSSSQKKSVPSGSTSKSPTSTAAPAAKPDPNKPPNARDPGFRKSFNLGEPPSSNGSAASSEPKDIVSPQRSEALNVPVNGKEKMYTLDKYGDDYLAVSPRTNVTVPEGASANRGLSTVSPLDEEAAAALGIIHEHKQKDPISGAAKALDELPSAPKDPNFGRDQFALGERKDSGFVEPVPTRDTTVSPDVKPVHPTTFNLESTPLQGPSSEPIPLSTTSTAEPSDVKSASLLSPLITTEDGSSSIYSDDSSRPPLQQIASSVYSQPATSPILNSSTPPTTNEHQEHYTSLVSDVLPNSATSKGEADLPNMESPKPQIDENSGLLTVVRSNFGDPAKAGEVSPPILPTGETNAWSQGLIADLDNVKVITPQPIQEQSTMGEESIAGDGSQVPDTVLKNPEASIDQQAEAFANIVSAHVKSLTEKSKASKLENSISEVPDVLPLGEKPIITTTNTVPHADAAHMGDLPGVLPPDQKPIITTTNTVPHADAAHMGDLPDVLALEAKQNVDTVDPISTVDEEPAVEKPVVGKSQLPNRPPLVHDDSVYAVTKDIPGAF